MIQLDKEKRLEDCRKKTFDSISVANTLTHLEGLLKERF